MKPWVAGVFGPIARYNRPSTTLTRSQLRYATRPLLTASVDTPADTPIEGRLAPFDLTRSLQFEQNGMIAPLAESAIGTLLLQNPDGALDKLDDDAAIVGREVDLSVAALTGGTTVGGSIISDVLAVATGGSGVFEDDIYDPGVYDATSGGAVISTLITEQGQEIATGSGSSASVLDSFGSIYSGVVEAIGWDRATCQVTVRDFRLKLQQQVQRNTYSGGGGIDGVPELANVTRPYALGNCPNVRATLIDPVRLIYQVHDGEMRAIDAVYDMGVALTAMLEVPSYAALAALESASEDSEGDIPLGAFAPCPTVGCFRLGGIPAGTVTADIRGAGGADTLREAFSDGTLFTDGTGFRSAALALYSRTAGMTIERLLINAGFTDAEISLAQIAQMDRERNYEIGIYLAAGEQRTFADLVGLCARSMGCVLIRSLDGRYQLRAILPPHDTPVMRIGIEAQDQGKLVRQTLPYRQPWSDVDIVYGHNWTPMGASDVAGAVPLERRNLLARIDLISHSTNAELAAVYPERAPMRVETALTNDGDAQALGQQLLAFYTRGRQRFSVPVRGATYRLELMDSIRLTAPRFGLDAGKDLIVISVRENGTSLATDVELFG
jgi:hypothetical protein